MNPALEKVAKYISLEINRNYDNRAVVGGLQRMLEPWETEARSTGVPENVIEVVVARLRDYPQLSISSRQEALEGLGGEVVGLSAGIVETGEDPAAAPIHVLLAQTLELREHLVLGLRLPLHRSHREFPFMYNWLCY